MSLDLMNVVVKNSYYNYFKYNAKEDEELTLDAVLENAILATQRTECQQSGDTYIEVFDSKMNKMGWIRTCTKHLNVTFPANGKYIFHIQYPNNKGYFTADSSIK